MLKITGFVNFRPYLQSFASLEEYVYQLKEQVTDIVTNPSHRFMECDLSK